MKSLALICLLAFPAEACESHDGLPDISCTPGATNLAVTQENIHQTICVKGYTKTIRPPLSVTNPIKRERMKAYGLEGQPMQNYELDHKLPLEIGGNPIDINNLWPEPYQGEYNAHVKDKLENHLHDLICTGQITLKEAQDAISGNWIEAYKKYFCEGDACAP